MGWLLVGMAAGMVATAALAFFVFSTIRGDAPTEALQPPLFIEETSIDGIDHVYDGEFEFFVGGGVAVFDCNGDRRPELYLAGGENQAGLYANESSIGGELRFAKISDPITDQEKVTGAYPLDVDSDGWIDLAVLRVGENVMLRGLGGCRFERANELWGVDGGDHWTAAFSATWESGETLPTMVFGNYLALGDRGERSFECADHLLIRPSVEGYEAPHSLSPGWCTLSALFSDWGGTGRVDLRLANDRHYYLEGEEQLWRIEPGRRPSLYTSGDGWETLEIWGMGIASHDVTGDGAPEVFLTSQGDNKLQTLAGDRDRPTYEDMALTSGANIPRPFAGDTNRPSTAWHAEFDDVNNDGFIDLFVTKGNVEAMPEFAAADPNNLLLGQPDGTFVEGAEAAGVIDYERSRGAAVADLNLDGLLDVVVVDRREEVKTWRNVGRGTKVKPSPMGAWLAIDLNQKGPNLNAIGSWIEVRVGNAVMRREVTIGGGHAGGHLGWTHFGVGTADEVDVRVVWPDRVIGPWITLDSNQFVTIDRQSGGARSWPLVPD